MFDTVIKHRYVVVEKLGEESLFTVYRCEDRIDNRIVAIKALLPQYASNRLFAERLITDAQAMVGFAHPGIVEVYGTVSEPETYCVILEYTPGTNLKERIRTGAPFPLAAIVDIGLAVCETLDFAHKHGFIHGDLHPGNIIITHNGEIKLTDFWVTSAVRSIQSLRTASMVRSIHYVCPEVAEGKPATTASDIYSTGVILFELLTGNVPFEGDTPIAIALKHANEPVPSVSARKPEIPKELDAIVSKALQKSPSKRFPSAKAMYAALREIKDSLGPRQPTAWSRSQVRLVTTNEEPIEEEMGLLSTVRKALIGVVALIAILVAVMLAHIMTRPADVTVPNLVGKNLDEARRIAAAANLRVEVRSKQYNEEYPKGEIYFTNPAPGRIIKEGKVVDLWVSKGSRFALVPNLIDIPIEEARSRLEQADLDLAEVESDYSDTISAGNVIKQFPLPGTRVERGQAVKLVFSLGPKPEEIQPPGEENPFEPQQYQDSSNETRSFDVKFVVPPGPEENRKIDITVEDKNGTTLAYSEMAKPGDQIEQTVEGVGNRITIRIYIDGKLVHEEKKWK